MNLTVGQILDRKGYFTEAWYLRSQPSGEVERRVGYGAGRLAKGWWLLFLTRKPTLSEFECRGYSQMSDGIPYGHLPAPPDPRNAEQRMRDDGIDLPRVKSNLVNQVFQISGHRRLAKIYPCQNTLGGNEYPPGSGIPQWELVQPVPFRVAAFVGPGETYTGNYQ